LNIPVSAAHAEAATELRYVLHGTLHVLRVAAQIVHAAEVDVIAVCAVAGKPAVRVELKETKTAFIIQKVMQTGKWIDPPLDDVFRDTDKCIVKKGGSKHALTFWDGGFCLYPFRAGVPFAFDLVKGAKQ